MDQSSKASVTPMPKPPAPPPTPVPPPAALTEDEIKKEYAQNCAQLGENKYRIAVLEQQSLQLMTRISELSVEAEKLASEKSKGEQNGQN